MTTKIIRPRDAQAAFNELQERLFSLMDSSDCFATVIVSSRYDPAEDDIPRIADHVERLITVPETENRFVRDGKLSIEILPPPTQEIYPGKYALCTPRGFDFAESQGHFKDEIGHIGEAAKGVAWRTKQRWRWIRTAVSVLKKAASKIPRDESGVVYIQVPEDDLHVVWLRVRVLAEEIRQILRHEHRRISAVVVTGEGQWMKTYANTGEQSAVVSTFYEVIENAETRNPLPKEFKLFGRDFKAT